MGDLAWNIGDVVELPGVTIQVVELDRRRVAGVRVTHLATESSGRGDE